jgi:hypothetical protein
MNDIIDEIRSNEFERMQKRDETLCAEIERLRSALAVSIENCKSLLGELAAAKRDTARYRWLRDTAGNDIMRRLMNSAVPSKWDDMIDEAMKGMAAHRQAGAVSAMTIESPAATDDDEIDDRDDSPYCDCGVFHDEEEQASGRCSCCGKMVEEMPWATSIR